MVSLLRRNEAQVLSSPDGKIESRPLARAGAGPGRRGLRAAPGRPRQPRLRAPRPGTRELIVVLGGTLKMWSIQESYLLAMGDSLVFPADQKHVYENPGSTEGRYHNVIVYRR